MNAQKFQLVLGAVLLLAGTAVIGKLGYETVWKDRQALIVERELRAQLIEQWKQQETQPEEKPGPADSSNTIGETTRPLGRGFAVIHIPRLGSTWNRVIVEGVTLPDLDGTLGHFPDSQSPGEVGNFALAGHRMTHGAPMKDINKMVEGDNIYVETADRWFTYTVTSHKIIKPTDIDVTYPVPFKKGVAPTKATMVITACHPQWSASQRYALFAELTDVRLKLMGKPDGLVASTRK